MEAGYGEKRYEIYVEQWKIIKGSEKDNRTMLRSMKLAGTNVLADRAYDANSILYLLQGQHAHPEIPSKNLARFSDIVIGSFIKDAMEWNAFSKE